MNKVIETYLEFKTEENLPENWIKSVWVNNGFASYIPFPTEYDVFLDEVIIEDLLKVFYDALKDWFRTSGCSFEEIIINYSDERTVTENDFNWQTLMNEGIDYKPLTCIIGTLILRFLEETSNLGYFKDALLAVRLYLFLVTIPGSHICQIFNSTLYSHVMAVIKISCEQIDESTIGKNKGTKRKIGETVEDMTDDSDYPSNRATYDKFELIHFMNDFLKKLKCILENKKLKLDTASLNLAIQILVMITRLEKTSNTLLLHSINSYRRDSISYLSYKSFMILLSLSNILNSDPRESIKLVIKELLPMFLVNEMRSLGLTVKDLLTLVNNYVSFLKLLLEKSKENAYEALNILVQRICVAVPDRAEMRGKAVSIVLDVLKISPPDLLSEQLYSIIFMSHMSETKIRLITLEIISKLLLEPENNIDFEQLPQKYAAVTNERFLLAVIIYRCQDASVSITTKALSYLDQFISSNNIKMKRLVDKIFVEPFTDCNDFGSIPGFSKQIFDTHQFLLDQQNFDVCSINPLPGVKVILDMLIYFCQEDKVFIKKCAIQTLAKIFLCNRQWIKEELLQVLLISFDDSSVLIRKTACQVITDVVMMYPDHLLVIKCWVEGVTPMIAEEEIKAQEKVVEHFCKVILNNIMLYNHTTSTVSRLPWLVMKEILSAQDKKQYLHFAVLKWVQSGAIKNRTVQTIYSHIDSENNWIVWSLLFSLAQCIDLPTPKFVYEYYERILPNLEKEPHSQLVLGTLYYVCSALSTEIKRKLLEQLESNITECNIPLKLIAESRNICELIINYFASDNKAGHVNVVDWSSKKISICLDYIKSQIGKDAPINIENPDLLIKHIFLLGELAEAAPKKVTTADVKLFQNIMVSSKHRETGMWKGRANTAIKAVTILTLTKLVLQKENSVSSIMPIFKEILCSNSIESNIQVNTIIGMCDLCTRYTTLVERYFTSICKCFNSPHECVRKTALVSVVKRVREEYVKLRPFILFPMLTMTLDKSVEIRRKIAAFIGIDLKKKNNILETVYTGLFFFMNNCKDHSTTVKIPDDLRTIFSLTDKPKDRRHIYIYVLDKLADTSRRLVVCKKIVHDIIASIADNALKLDEKTEDILNDAFYVLVDNEKKISEAITKSKKNNTEDVDDIEDVEVNRENKKSQIPVVTENHRFVEANEIMPSLLKIRLLLKQHKSKCLPNLMKYLCELLKNYKNELTDILGGDDALKAEIERGIRVMEQVEKRRQEDIIKNRDDLEIEIQSVKVPALAVSSEEIREQLQNLIENRGNGEGLGQQAQITSPEEIREKLQNLIIQLSRCDDIIPSEPHSSYETNPLDTVPLVQLNRCDLGNFVKNLSLADAREKEPKKKSSSSGKTSENSSAASEENQNNLHEENKDSSNNNSFCSIDVDLNESELLREVNLSD